MTQTQQKIHILHTVQRSQGSYTVQQLSEYIKATVCMVEIKLNIIINWVSQFHQHWNLQHFLHSALSKTVSKPCTEGKAACLEMSVKQSCETGLLNVMKTV